MAISETQKVDYLWKKLAYGRAKTDTNANKKATNESISSPLLLRGNNVWSQADLIPGVMPASTTGVVTVYPTSAPDETTADVTATASRTWKTGLTDWIPPEIGSTYLVKVYIHTSSDASNAAGSGTQVFGAGSGNNDEWFFDYQAGTLHFVGTNLPNGVSFSGKSVYVSGARYTGIKGVAVPGATADFTDVTLTDTDAGSSAGPELKLYRNSATPADADYLGQIKFAGESDTGVERNYAKITGKISDATNTTEDGIIEFAHIKAGTQTITGRWNSTTLQLLNGTSLSVAGDATITGTITGNVTGDLTGAVTGNVTGNVTGDLTGNADTATALETARTIGGVSFDGTAAINLPGVNASGNQDTSGNAATATALATARNIGGVSFDGTAAINLPGVNASGNQDTSGTAALASGLTGTPGITVGAIVGTNLTLSGNLTVNGDTTTLSTTTLDVEDLNITVAKGAADSSAANGAGLTVDGAGATFNYTHSGTKWVANKSIEATSFIGDITGDVTGAVTGNVTGNADTATALATARNIGGVSFDGTAAINLPGVNAAGNQDTSGNAATATALETARNIGGVSFDGSAAINLPGVNAAGNQDTTGNAATATVATNAQGLTGTPNISCGTGAFSGVVTLQDNLDLQDDDKILVGTGDDLEIYHDGTDNFIKSNTALKIQASGSNSYTVHISARTDKDTIKCYNNTNAPYVELFHDNSKRFETTSDGVDISGTGSIKVPVGTTLQRNGSPVNGDIRYNTDLNSYEGYGNNAWGGLGGGTEIDQAVSSTSATNITTFAHASYRSAQLRVQITQGSAYQVGKYLLIHDGTTVTVVEESAIATGDMLGSISGAISGSNVEIKVTMNSSSSATVTTIVDKITV